MHMNAITVADAPTIQVTSHRRSAIATPRPSIDDALEAARLDPDHEDWFWLFESHSNLAIPGAADLRVVQELIASSPSDFLAGYVTGLFVNN